LLHRLYRIQAFTPIDDEMDVGWRESSVVEERLRFVQECQSQEWSLAEVCRRFGISRITGYKWLERYEEGGVNALQDRSRAPHNHPNQVLDELEEAILSARGAHPHWGPVKLRSWLVRTEPQVPWPAISTMGEILRRHGLTVPRKKRQRATPSSQPLQHAQGPNSVWCADYKGWFRCQDGSRCDPLTITDAFSRFLLKCQAAKHADFWHTQPLFEAAFREYGLPDRIRVDNGSPFASTGIGGLSELSVWWVRLGIHPERIQPGKPAQNGRHERMHRTMKQETADPPRRDLRDQQRAFDEFRQQYNQQRPHQALHGKTPADLYQCSNRPFPSRLEPVIYPPEFEIRFVSNGGHLRWNSAKVFVGHALEGQPIGLEPLEQGRWRVWFSFCELGEMEEANLLIRRTPLIKLASC
jgi:putative transposase